MLSIDEAKQSDYRYLPPKSELYNPDLPIITIIIDCYYKLNLVKQSIQSILKQNYQNTELLLIDNGAEELVSDYIRQVYEKHKNIALIKFKENQFSWEDTQKIVVICWNVGVLHAKGLIIGHLNYDDMISRNCCSKMARLFSENSNCVTAGPLPLSIDIEGNINKEFSNRLKLGNRRPRYIDGKKLALDRIDGSPNKYLSAPGGVLFIKKDTLIQCGGFDRASDITQVIKFAIHGDSGFDPKAKLFWRHHDGQLNKLAKNRGVVWCDDLIKAVRNENIIEMWSNIFSKNDVKKLKKYINNDLRKVNAMSIIELIRQKNLLGFFMSSLNTLRKCPLSVPYLLYYSFFEVMSMMKEKSQPIKK